MTPVRDRLFLGVLGLALLHGSVVRGEDDSLKLQAVALGGTRTSVTEDWGIVNFTIENPAATARLARVLVFYPSQPDVQYGRDLWVPAKSSMTAWMPIGPVPPDRSQIGRELEMLLFDRTDGQDRLVLPPTEERVRSRALAYKRREVSTALFIDVPAGDPGAISRPGTRASEIVQFAHVIRRASAFSEHAFIIPSGYLAPSPEVLDGIDQVVLAGNRLATDPPGRETLRQWVQQGGRLWVMLDMVDPEVIAPIFGHDSPFQVVDRVSLTTVVIHRARDGAVAVAARDFERPVDLVRVIPSPAAHVNYTVNGWPASFVLPLGRGKVVFTTLGPSGWHRPRLPEDRMPNDRRPDLPMPLSPLEDLSADFRPSEGRPRLTPDDLRPLLTEEIGYTIVGRPAAGAILGGFVIALAALGIGLRRSRRPELVGWLAPAAAVGAAAIFVVLGEGSRRAVPPTVAVAEIVDAVPGSGELAASGLFAIYQPASGPVLVGTKDGALLDLDQEGLAGQTRRRVQTDHGAWHWENLSLPAGVRTGTFTYTARTEGMRATARFGPDGVEGRFASGPYRKPVDALVSSTGREFIAAPLGADGTFTAGLGDMLPAGQFLPGSVLTDQQQRRQAIYRQLLAGRLPPHLDGRDLFLTWAEPGALPFAVPEGARTIGTALVIVPLEFEPPAPGTRVTIPRAFVPFRRVTPSGLLIPTLEAGSSVEQRLRFQLPPSVLPLTLERATLHLKIRAPSRRLTVSGLDNQTPVVLFEGDSPTEALRLEIADPRLLRSDGQGGLHLMMTVGPSPEHDDAKWTVEILGLDVVGKTGTE
jgi:hypothetical protein